MEHLLWKSIIFLLYSSSFSLARAKLAKKGLGSQLEGSKVIILLKTAVETR